MHRKIVLFIFITMLAATLFAQQPGIKVLESGKKVSIRGLSVVTDDIVWASGSSGSVARSIDGGNTWTWMVVPGYEKRDFRDIEAFDANTAVIIGIAEPAVILKTTDGGQNWKKVFEDSSKGVFLDAMHFSENGGIGTIIGDPLPGSDFVYGLYTTDEGNTWKKLPSDMYFKGMKTKEGEAFFASSGTNIAMAGNHPIFVSGGKSSRLYIGSWYPLPIMQGKESTGANSIAVYDDPRKAVIVGGDFAKDTISSNNCVLVTFRSYWTNKTRFKQPKTPPHGYRSCVIYLDKNNLLTCGTSGIDISKDGGDNWELISRESYHVCQKAKNGTAVFLAGGGGRIAKLMR